MFVCDSVSFKRNATWNIFHKSKTETLFLNKLFPQKMFNKISHWDWTINYQSIIND